MEQKIMIFCLAMLMCCTFTIPVAIKMKKSMLILGSALSLMFSVAGAAYAMKSDQVEFSGYLGLRYDYGDNVFNNNGEDQVLTRGANFDLATIFHIDEKTKVKCHVNSISNLSKYDSKTYYTTKDNEYGPGYTTEATSDGNVTHFDASVLKSIGNFDLTIGQFNPRVAYGLVKSDADISSTPVKGLEAVYHFSGALQARAFIGKLENVDGMGNANDALIAKNAYVANDLTYLPFHSGDYNYVEVGYRFPNLVNLKGAYHNLSHEGVDFNVYEIGSDFKVAEKLGAIVSVSKSNTDNENDMAYMAQLKYGQAAFWAIPGSYDLFIAYHNNPVTACIDGGTSLDFDGGRQFNFKGITVGGHYTLSRMILLTGFYLQGETIDNGRDYNMFRMQIDFLI